ITGAINRLNEEQRVPFSLYVSGYKYNEIADKLDMPLGTVKSRIFFARQELQKQLKDFRRE
ncbi:MAG: RNA polymerase sigma factor, partial [Tannerellaceae bacterium]|nr:RNA polymerase sigma factor [Tannerellaceae bacterium]